MQVNLTKNYQKLSENPVTIVEYFAKVVWDDKLLKFFGDWTGSEIPLKVPGSSQVFHLWNFGQIPEFHLEKLSTCFEARSQPV